MTMVRVSRRNPCPVCKHADWCMVATDGGCAICPRTPTGSTRYIEDSGYLHIVDAAKCDPNERKDPEPPPLPERNADLAALQAVYIRAADEKFMIRASANLGLPDESLRMLHIGYDSQRGLQTFPMIRHGVGLVGIRTRSFAAEKKAVVGSRQGLFIPRREPARILMVCEGPTDTAAMLSLGFWSVGRPQAIGGERLVAELLQSHQPRTVAIWADRDGWIDTEDRSEAGVGWHGACQVAGKVGHLVENVIVCWPPAGSKDVRQWICGGAKADDVKARTVWCRKDHDGTQD